MNDLDDVLNSYLAAVDSLHIVSSFIGKTTERPIFHHTIFRGMTPDEAQELIGQTESEIRDLAVVALIGVFERILSRHPKSPIHTEASQSDPSSWFQAMSLFEDSVTHELFHDVERVGKYRDWVAHGKRWDQPEIPEPITALDLLKKFLKQANQW